MMGTEVQGRRNSVYVQESAGERVPWRAEFRRSNAQNRREGRGERATGRRRARLDIRSQALTLGRLRSCQCVRGGLCGLRLMPGHPPFAPQKASPCA